MSFDQIDWWVRSVNSNSPDSLARQLTAPFQTDLEKVRAIFSWIAQNIRYNTGIYSPAKVRTVKYQFDPLDTMSVWTTGDEMTAIRVLNRRVTVCEGYAKLFKVLCDYANIKCELVYGYAKNGMRRYSFKSNHTWNVVMIDSTWKPIDVTWASGYINQWNEFVPEIEEKYFLPRPEDFIVDHYPENLRWALVKSVPSIKEFENSPFRYKCFDKYIFTSFSKLGEIEIEEGDTVRLELNMKNAARDRQISSDPFFDSTIEAQSPRSAFLHPSIDNNKITYTYLFTNTSIEWLHLFYNNDLILRYHLRLKNK